VGGGEGGGGVLFPQSPSAGEKLPDDAETDKVQHRRGEGEDSEKKRGCLVLRCEVQRHAGSKFSPDKISGGHLQPGGGATGLAGTDFKMTNKTISTPCLKIANAWKR